jgi:light-regulated signal transduction histidine kinase (bacteriophytochrome)
VTSGHSGFDHEYASALGAYLERGDEAALSAAYELGRRAMAEGLGVLDMAAVHGAAVKALLGSASIPEEPFVGTAGGFFQELLSPFEMSFRGYREANEQLQRLNETLRQQKDAVEVANRELESFSYSVSHDLRAPLRRIDGYGQAMLDDCADALDEQSKNYLGHIREAAQEMMRLIDDLLGLARVTRTEMHPAEADLTAIARRIIDRLRSTAPERCVRFDVHEGMHANCDARLLAILLENLLGNAWKFTSKRALVEIEFGAMQQGGQKVYFVRDNGAGFNMDYAAKLFGAFQRLHSAREFEGTGIGLATVQRIARRHGGRVWAEGKVGLGATFFFTLGEGAHAP